MRVAFSNFSIDVNKREKVERKMGEKQSMLQPQIEYIPIKDLTISPFNVRKQVGDLTDLKGSIKSMGVLQPIIVRPIEGKLEVVVGQRRFFACKELGWENIPAVKRKLTDREALILSLTENVQIDSIDAIDRAEATKRLIEDLENEMPRSKAVEEAAELLGKTTWTIYDWLRLLETTEAVKRMVQEKKISIDTGARLASLPKERQAEVAEVIHEEYLPQPQAAKAIEYVRKRPELPVRKAVKTFLEEVEEYSVTVSFPGLLYKALSEFAQSNKLTIQEVIRRAVRKYLES